MQDRVGTEAETYRHGQVVAGAWNTFLLDSAPPALRAEPSRPFRTRCRRLVELGVGPGGEKPRSGTDRTWTLKHAAELAFGLELWDRGVNQRDIAFIIKHARPLLDEAFDFVVEHALPVRRFRQRGQPDTTLWLLHRGHELRELYPDHDPAIHYYTRPELVFGLSDLAAFFEKVGMRATDRGFDVFELSGLFGLTIENVRAAPLIRRGRP